LNERDICLGCYRTLEEIVGWSAASDEERVATLERAQSRRQNPATATQSEALPLDCPPAQASVK
jgi:predicted Fe-S protein YdhL (DUF1289 family)